MKINELVIIVKGIEEKLEDFVTKDLFEAKLAPVRAIAYGLMALIALAVGGALLKLVLKT